MRRISIWSGSYRRKVLAMWVNTIEACGKIGKMSAMTRRSVKQDAFHTGSSVEADAPSADQKVSRFIDRRAPGL